MFSTRAAAALTAACHRPVQFQDLGGVGYQWDRLYERAKEALTLQPKLLVMVVTPYDLEQSAEEQKVEAPQPASNGLIPRIRRHLVDFLGVKQLSSWNAFLYFRVLSPDFFLQTFLHNPDGSGFVRPTWPPSWQKRIADLNTLLTRVADLSHQAGVPLLLIYSPDRAQVLLSHWKTQYPGYDPLALDRAIGAAAHKLNIDYIDMTPRLTQVRNVGAYFYVMSDHLTPRGHALMASMLVESILASHNPAFTGCGSLPATFQIVETARGP
jgi:hypothetical protein